MKTLDKEPPPKFHQKFILSILILAIFFSIALFVINNTQSRRSSDKKQEKSKDTHSPESHKSTFGIIEAKVAKNFIMKKGQKDPQNLIVMVYDPKEFTEDVSVYQMKQDRLSLVNRCYLSDIRQWNRSLRYITTEGKLAYLQTLKKIYIDKDWYVHQSPIKGSVFEIELYAGDLDKVQDQCVEPIYVERDFKTGESRRRIFRNFQFYCAGSAHNQQTVFRDPSFSVSKINNAMIGVYDFQGYLALFTIPVNIDHSESYNFFENLKNSIEYDGFNPLMSENGKLIAIDIIKMKEISDCDLLNQRMHILKFRLEMKTEKDPKTKPSDQFIIERNGWSILLLHRGSPQKVEVPVSSYRLFKRDTSSPPIPNKCWSPSGNSLLFVGALEEPGVGNVYTVDVRTKETSKILEANDTSGEFNPSLDWTEHGILITCPDKIYFKYEGKNFRKLPLPAGIGSMKEGRISPDGKMIMFFGKRKGQGYVFIINLNSGKITEKCLDQTNMDNVQGGWIFEGKISIIKNRMDNVDYHRMYTNI